MIAARTMSRLFLGDMTRAAVFRPNCGSDTSAERHCKPRATHFATGDSRLARGIHWPRTCPASRRWLGMARTLLAHMTVRVIWSVLSQAVLRFSDDAAFTLGAALAYYSLLSIAPLLLVAVSFAGAFFAYGDVRMELVDQMHRLTGPEGAALTQTVIDHTMSQKASLWSLLVGT